jgi:hypothetical protein
MSSLHSRGFTIPEMCIAAALSLTVFGILAAYQHAATKAGRQSVAQAESLRAILVACETLRDDLASMVCHDPAEDIAILDRGRGLSFRAASVGTDLLRGRAQVVTYSLQPIPGQLLGYQLMRQDERSTRPVAGCYLRDMVVTCISSGFRDPGRIYLEITLVGMESEAADTVIETFLVPIHLQPLLESA